MKKEFVNLHEPPADLDAEPVRLGPEARRLALVAVAALEDAGEKLERLAECLGESHELGHATLALSWVLELANNVLANAI